MSCWLPIIQAGPGRLGGGGGGGALGDATVWGTELSPVADFASLPSSDLRNGDFARVTDIDAGFEGTAYYDSTAWKIVEVRVSAVSDFASLSNPIATGAIGIVDYNYTYVYDGSAWNRGGVNPMSWTLTDITDTDPSGVGVTEDGDAGELNGRLYVLATLTKDAGAGGGTFQAWIDPVVETWTTPTVHATLIGTEADDTARLDVGWSTVLSGTGSVVPDVSGSGLSRLLSPVGSANSSEINCASGDIVTASRVYFRAMIRAETSPAGVFELAAMAIYSSSPNNAAIAGQGTSSSQLWRILNNTWNTVSGATTRVTPTAIGSVDPVLVEILRETTGYTELRVGGQTWQVAPSQGGSALSIVKALSAAAPSTSDAWLDIGSAIVIVGS